MQCFQGPKVAGDSVTAEPTANTDTPVHCTPVQAWQQNKLSCGFSGGGFLLPYHLGCYQSLAAMGIVSPTETPMAGSSAGSLVSWLRGAERCLWCVHLATTVVINSSYIRCSSRASVVAVAPTLPPQPPKLPCTYACAGCEWHQGWAVSAAANGQLPGGSTQLQTDWRTGAPAQCAPPAAGKVSSGQGVGCVLRV